MAKSDVRYPHQLVLVTDERQNEAVRAVAEREGRSVSEVLRGALAAGLPVYASRLRRDREALEREQLSEGAA
jgi:hypothetical protein